MLGPKEPQFGIIHDVEASSSSLPSPSLIYTSYFAAAKSDDENGVSCDKFQLFYYTHASPSAQRHSKS